MPSQSIIRLATDSVSNVCKLLQLMGDFVPRHLPGLRPWTLLGTFVSQTPWALAFPNENSWHNHDCLFMKIIMSLRDSE